MTSNPPANARLDNLLTLRVLATFAVVFGHASGFFGAFTWSQFPQSPYIQSQAVTVFFLVSGYTIAWVCDRDARKGRGVAGFIYDRAVRLLVPLIPILLLVAGVEAWIFDAHPYEQNFTVGAFIGNVLFLQNIKPLVPGLGTLDIFGVGPFGTNRPLWTISLEFWIYVAFAGSFFAAVGRRYAFGLAASLIGVFGWLMLNNDILGGRGAGLTIVWLVGALVYWALKRVPTARIGTALLFLPIGAVVAMLLATPYYWPSNGTNSPTYNMLLAVAFFLLIAVCPRLPARWNKAMSWLGDFAYTAYLAHYPIQYWFWKFEILPRGPIGAISATAISIFASFVLGMLFERHYKRVRDWVRNSLLVPTFDAGKRYAEMQYARIKVDQPKSPTD